MKMMLAPVANVIPWPVVTMVWLREALHVLDNPGRLAALIAER